jgi:hypothetical protein
MPVLYAATAPFISRSTDTPADQQFEAALEATIRIDRQLSDGSGGYGGWSESISELSLINADGLYDSLAATISVNGQKIRCSVGQFDSAGLVVQRYNMFEQFAILISERFNISRQHMTIFMRDPLAHLQQALVQQHTYGGTGGVDGGAEIAGKRKPFMGGYNVFNITPTLVIPEELLYQVHDGPVRFILPVRDGGVSLDLAGNFETVVALRAAAAAFTIQPGTYATCLQEGYFVLGGANEKQITADVYGFQITTAELASYLAARSSGRSLLDDNRHDDIARLFLTDGFLTANATTGFISDYTNAFSNDSKSTGKYIFTLRPIVTTGSDYGFGFANSSASVSPSPGQKWLGSDSNSVGVYGPTGSVFFNLATTGETGNTFTANDLVTVAVDVGARLWWYKVGSGNYNNNGAANPATGVGGFALHFIGDVFAGLVLSNVAVIAISFLPEQTPPSGYSTWGTTGFFGLDVASVDALEALQPALIGCYLDSDSSMSVADLLSQILAGIGGWFSFSPFGFFQIFRFDAPTAAQSIATYDTNAGDMLEIDRTALPDSLDPPPKRRRVKYQRNYTVQTDLFGQVTEDDPGLADQLRSESQLATTADAQATSIVADFSDAPDPEPVEAYFFQEADALAEANRLLTLYSSGRLLYRFAIRNALFSHKVGDVVQVIDSRLGLSAGKYVRIVSLSDDASNMTTEVQAFG